MESVRVDSWLWGVRVFKTRTLASDACKAGHVRVNGERAKPAQPVKVGDEVRVRIQGFDRVLGVAGLVAKRGSPAVAQAAADHRTPPRPPREETPFIPSRERGAGRPTKRDRRELERLRGRD